MTNRTDMTVTTADLTRRERQVLDILYTQGAASVGQMQSRLPDGPSYSATRMLLQRLHKKGQLTVQQQGPKYIYATATPKPKASGMAWRALLRTFFDGSPVNAFSAFLGSSTDALTDAELAELERLVVAEQARRR